MYCNFAGSGLCIFGAAGRGICGLHRFPDPGGFVLPYVCHGGAAEAGGVRMDCGLASGKGKRRQERGADLGAFVLFL